MRKENKVKFGLKNVHFAVLTETRQEDNTIKTTYDTISPWPGGVSMSMDPTGENVIFYADNREYSELPGNAGYEGDFESALIPEKIYTDVYGQDKVKGAIVESNNPTQKYIALLFEFDGDATATRYIFYKCSLTRAAVSSKTTEESKEVQTESVTIKAMSRSDAVKINGEYKYPVKAFSTPDMPEEIYNNWYNQIFDPSDTDDSSTEPQG